jgi:phage terminase large subunit
MELTRKQTEALELLEDKQTQELFFGGGAGGGKSLIGCYWTSKSAIRYPGSRWLIGRSELKNLKKTTLLSFFEVCRMQGLRANVDYYYNAQESFIQFPNESLIFLHDLFSYPSDPEFDSLGSLELTGAFVDEAPQISEKAKNILKSRIRYRHDEYGIIPKLLMCGNPSKNWVYYEFYKPSITNELRSDRKFIQSLATDNPNISQHYIASLKGLDKNSRERLLNGNFEYDNDPSTLIDYDAILNCFENVDLAGGQYCITADIARFGKDNTVIGLWNGYRVRLSTHKKISTKETADIIRGLQRQYQIPNHKVLIDADGIGGGVVDNIRCKDFVNNSKPLNNDNYANLKSQCYFKLAERINKNQLYIEQVSIEIKKMIIEELEQVKEYNMDKDGKKQILPKDKVKEVIRRSPDYSDTLMMREWFDLAPQYRAIVF